MARLFVTLSDEHLDNDAAITCIVRAFSAFSIETRIGGLVEEDLRNRHGVRAAYAFRAFQHKEAPPKKPNLLIADEKYPLANLEDSIFSDQTLVAMFVDGRYPKEEIRLSLNSSSYFMRPTEVAPWLVLVNFDQIDDDLVEDAVARMDRQFQNREVTNSGELLHIFALRMMMAESRIAEESIDECAASCIQYLNDLHAEGKLPARETGWEWYESFERSYQGRGYWVSESVSPYFQEVFRKLILLREEALELKLPEIHAELLNLIQCDSKAFIEKVSPTKNGENPYELIPILHGIPPVDFVDAWLGSQYKNWRNIYFALQNRYSHGRIETDLAIEQPWCREVHSLLNQRVVARERF